MWRVGSGIRDSAGFLSCLAGIVVFGILLATSSVLPMAWDEGNAINRAAGILDWVSNVRNQGLAAFGDAEVARHWHYTVEVEGHPALYGIVISLGQGLAQSWLVPLTASRLGPMMLFGIAAGGMFYRLMRQYSFAAAVGAAAALVTMPRLFSHAHFASFDGPLMSCWMLAWATFAPTIAGTGNLPRKSSWRRFWLTLMWGAALGGTMSCKFTGWLAIAPFAAYGVAYGNRQTAKTLAVGLVAALGTFWLVNPRLWHHPIGGMQRFFDMNLNRAGTAFDIATLFFGTVYNQSSGLPWYNSLVWSAVTVPVPVLLLAGLGIASAVRRWRVDGQRMLLLLNWVVLIVVRALPGAPVHDAERLILPSFVFLAALAGVGCHNLLEWARTTPTARPLRWRLVVAGLAVAYAGAASGLLWYAPQWLSYYNLLIGGLRGADSAGMEATYYWDALDSEVLDWLHENTHDDEKVDFSRPSSENLALAQRLGVLRRGWMPEEPGEYRWYVIQRRQTFWMPGDRWLVEHETPAFVKTIRPPEWGFGPWRLDVPLIEVFSFEQHRRSEKRETQERLQQHEQATLPLRTSVGAACDSSAYGSRIYGEATFNDRCGSNQQRNRHSDCG